MEECEFKLNFVDFTTLMMGAGVGYFIVGYLISSCICGLINRNNDDNSNSIDNPILAEHVV